jgi:hypothetical protein
MYIAIVFTHCRLDNSTYYILSCGLGAGALGTSFCTSGSWIEDNGWVAVEAVNVVIAALSLINLPLGDRSWSPSLLSAAALGLTGLLVEVLALESMLEAALLLSLLKLPLAELMLALLLLSSLVDVGLDIAKEEKTDGTESGSSNTLAEGLSPIGDRRGRRRGCGFTVAVSMVAPLAPLLLLLLLLMSLILLILLSLFWSKAAPFLSFFLALTAPGAWLSRRFFSSEYTFL